ncbi:MAG TPA: metal-dependent hydrolase [Solirubrobacteraceae bacterium]|nr:metal-dependent hydrolase [Solirubrobacteraceae bacterium]
MTEIRFLGHAAFTISDGHTTVLIDPFLTGNPKAAISADDVSADTILVTHAHADHVGDTVAISKRTGAPVVAIVELAAELEEAGAASTIGINFGGTAVFDWGWAKMVPAWHTGVSDKGVATTPAGFLINFKDTIVYHLGDTGLFSDLKLVGKRHPVDVALIPVGGHFTMDPVDGVDAADFIGAQTVIPCHYNTFPAIEIDVSSYQRDVEAQTSSHCVVLEPGQTHTV